MEGDGGAAVDSGPEGRLADRGALEKFRAVMPVATTWTDDLLERRVATGLVLHPAVDRFV